jgi:hypothetical protein
MLTAFDRDGALKVIKKRRAQSEARGKNNSNSYDGNEHFNTTFYDDILKEGGEAAVKSLLSEDEFKKYMENKKEAGEKKQYAKVELSDEDIEFLTQASEIAKEYEDQIPDLSQGDTLILP